jgi:hypothetical protein
MNPNFRRSMPTLSYMGVPADHFEVVNRMYVYLKGNFNLDVQSTPRDPSTMILPPGQLPYMFDIISEVDVMDALGTNHERHIIVFVIEMKTRASEIRSQDISLHPSTDFLDVDALQSPRMLFTPNALKTFVVSSSCDDLPDTICPAEGSVPMHIAAPSEPRGKANLIKPEAWYGIYNASNPKSLSFDDWRATVSTVIEYTNDTAPQAYTYVKSLLRGDSLSLLHEYEHLTPVTSRSADGLLDFLRPRNVKTDIENVALQKLQNTKMKSPASSDNYYKFRSQFEKNKLDGKITDDATLRLNWMKNLDGELKGKLYDLSTTPATVENVDCRIPGSRDLYTYDMLLSATDSLQTKMQAKHRSDQASSVPASGGGRGKKRHAADAQLRLTDTDNSDKRPMPGILFSKEEREAVGKGKNGTFRDDSPRTCNNCNSPDHLLGECKQTARKNAFVVKSRSDSRNESKSAESNNLSKNKFKKVKAELRQLKASLTSMSNDSVPVNPSTTDAFQPPPSRSTHEASVAASNTSNNPSFRQAASVTQAAGSVARLCNLLGQ